MTTQGFPYEDRTLCLVDAILGSHIAYLEQIDEAALWRVVDELIYSRNDTLGRQMSLIVHLRTCKREQRARLKAIGLLCGVSRVRIRQVETKMLRFLRHPSRLRQWLRDYVPEEYEYGQYNINARAMALARGW